MAKNIVILGAGFGGLQAAFQLSKELKKLKLSEQYLITLVDRNSYHTFTPLLYEIACTSRTTADDGTLQSLVAFPITELIRNTPITFLQDEVRRMNFIDKTIDLTSQQISFDYLILALGSEMNYFNIPGLRENSKSLKTFNDALALRNTIADLVRTNTERMIHVVVGGGGPTGVELASEIKMWARELTTNFSVPGAVHVSIIDGGPHVLSSLDARVIEKAEARLKKLGVGILTREQISRVTKSVIVLASGEKIHQDLLVWTGGVQANALAATLPVEREPRGRLEIEQTAECILQNESLEVNQRIFAIGDIACLLDPKTKKMTPAMARPALMQARIATHNIIELIKQEENLSPTSAPRAYTHIDYPYVIPVGGKFAVVKIGPFVISGFLGWIMKGLVELNYFFVIMPPHKALMVWLRGLITFLTHDKLG
ncbi:MAG: FAD-dependent oxidoreductase [Candidatus Paceibacterota bacterium]|jgi:NADH dehydrogenase